MNQKKAREFEQLLGLVDTPPGSQLRVTKSSVQLLWTDLVTQRSISLYLNDENVPTAEVNATLTVNQELISDDGEDDLVSFWDHRTVGSGHDVEELVKKAETAVWNLEPINQGRQISAD